jgi:hypothetical protein
MVLKAWALSVVTFLSACTSAASVVRGDDSVILLRPGHYQPMALSVGQFQLGMRMIMSRGPFPGLPRPVQDTRFVLVGVDPVQLQKAADYLQFCERSGKGYGDCWDVLTPSGGLDDPGSRSVALRIAFAEALQQAAAAVKNLTPDQVRLILDLTLIGAVLAVIDPNPWTKALFMISTANLIAYVGVDLFNNVVEGYLAMDRELGRARDFAAVEAAGLRFGERIGPTLSRLVLMALTVGVAKFTGLITGGTSLPGGPQAAALAEAQGFSLPAAEAAQSISLSPGGTVTIHLGAPVAMSAVNPAPSDPRSAADAARLKEQLAEEAASAELRTGGGYPIAGAGTNKGIDDVGRLVTQWGGRPQDWVKLTSKSYELPGGRTLEVHAYRNVQTGQTVELKPKLGFQR